LSATQKDERKEADKKEGEGYSKCRGVVAAKV